MMVEEMLILIFETHCPKWFIFDGAYPYRGMLNAIKEEETIEKIWVRRGMLKKGSSIPIDSVGHFDLIVHPEDAITDEEDKLEHNVNSIHISPITLIDSDEMWTRKQARKRLGVPEDCKVAYVQLGAGRINDIDSEIRTVVDALLKNDNIYIVLGESMLGERIEMDLERVHILRDYPNALYFKGFDISIQAGGYNSFHEMRKMQMPTLFLPNLDTGMDDQTARCKIADKEGWGITLIDRNQTLISTAIDELLNRKQSRMNYKNGSSELTNYLLKVDTK